MQVDTRYITIYDIPLKKLETYPQISVINTELKTYCICAL